MFHELITFLVAMMPVGELRASIPLALEVFNLPIWKAYFISVLGNMVPVSIILLLLKPATKALRKIEVFDNFFEWLFERTRKKAEEKYLVYGELALILFVAIPLPITGAWTGSVAAFLFDVPYYRAVMLIGIGVLISGLIVTLATFGASSFLNFLL